MLATIFNQSVESLSKSIKILSEFGLISKSKNGVISVKNWQKHRMLMKWNALKNKIGYVNQDIE